MTGSAGGGVRVVVRPDRTALRIGVEDDLHVVVDVVCDRVPAVAERAPLDLVVAIDRSGSMGRADGLDTAKACARFLVERLARTDRVALICFADATELLVPLSSPSEDHLAAVDALSPGGCTDLAAVFGEAVRVLADAEERGAARRAFVFSDAAPNTGQIRPEALGRIARAAREEHGIETSLIHVVGSASRGNAYPVALAREGVSVDAVGSPRDAPALLARQLDGLVTRVATDAIVEIRPGDHVPTKGDPIEHSTSWVPPEEPDDSPYPSLQRLDRLIESRTAVGPVDDPSFLHRELADIVETIDLDPYAEPSPAERLDFHGTPTRSSEGGPAALLGDLTAGITARTAFHLRVKPFLDLGPQTIGEVILRFMPEDAGVGARELRAPLVVDIVPSKQPATPTADREVLAEVANGTLRAVRDRWDHRTTLRGTRENLLAAAAKLRGMGSVGAPQAEVLERRVAELDADESLRDRVLEWCERSPSDRVVVLGEAGGSVGWVSVEASPPDRAKPQKERYRRLDMVGVARVASLVEAATTGAPAAVVPEGVPQAVPLAEVEGGLFRGWDWRFDPAFDIVPDPVPEAVVRWWEANRGWVSVRCALHGEIARFDAGRWIEMLGAAWDAAVVEYQARWEIPWAEANELERGFNRCRVRIEPTDRLGGPNLLDVEQMWVSMTAGGRQWWTYELHPSAGRSTHP